MCLENFPSPSPDSLFGNDPVLEFEYFTELELYQDCLKAWRQASDYDGTISLVETIEMWLWYGEGLNQCPTYESYLRVAILIIDAWLDGSCVRIGRSGVPLWESDGIEQRIPLFPDKETINLGEDSHSLLTRDRFERLRHQRLERSHQFSR